MVFSSSGRLGPQIELNMPQIIYSTGTELKHPDQLQACTVCHPSGTSQGVGNARHSFVNGLRAGAITCEQTTAGSCCTSRLTNLPSGNRTCTAPAAIGTLEVMRNEPMRSDVALGKNSER